MTDVNNKEIEGGVANNNQNEGNTQNDSGVKDTGNKIDPEIQALLDKQAEDFKQLLSGRDKAVGKLTNELQSLKAKEDAERLEKLSNEEKANVWKAKAESLEKESQFRKLCNQHGLKAEDYISSAMNLSVDELENFVSGIANSIRTATEEAERIAKEKLQSKAPTSQPNSELTNKTDKEKILADLKAKGLL